MALLPGDSEIGKGQGGVYKESGWVNRRILQKNSERERESAKGTGLSKDKESPSAGDKAIIKP